MVRSGQGDQTTDARASPQGCIWSVSAWLPLLGTATGPQDSCVRPSWPPCGTCSVKDERRLRRPVRAGNRRTRVLARGLPLARCAPHVSAWRHRGRSRVASAIFRNSSVVMVKGLRKERPALRGACTQARGVAARSGRADIIDVVDVACRSRPRGRAQQGRCTECRAAESQSQ